MFNEFLSFKKDSAFNLMNRLFNIGLIPMFIPAIWLGKYFAILLPVTNQVPGHSPGYYSFVPGPNYILGIITGMIGLIISIIIWKIICQGLLIVLQGFETYTSSNNTEE